MAERIMIEAQPREVVGKKTRRLRREGWIPAVIYGQQETLNVQIDNLALRRVLRDAGHTHLIDIKLDGDQRTVLAREIQSHVTRGDLIHVDFYEVNLLEKVGTQVEIITFGQSVPEEEGEGVTTQLLYSVDIEALPEALVSQIEIDLSQIKTPDDVLFVSDLVVPEGVTILTDPETAVAKFDYLREEEALEEEDELTSILEPSVDDVEVVGRGRDTEEEDQTEG